MGERDAKQYHPHKKDMLGLVELHDRLSILAERKRVGDLDADETKRLAVAAVDEANGGAPKPSDNGPLARLHRLCANGWIMEAASEMPLLYPSLHHPEEWVDPAAVRRRRTAERSRERSRFR